MLAGVDASADILSSKQMTQDIAACMASIGIDPITKEEVYVARGLRDRKMQRALLRSAISVTGQTKGR